MHCSPTSRPGTSTPPRHARCSGIGIGLYYGVYGIAGGSSDDLVLAPWWWLALVPVATLLIVAAATSLPARLTTRIPATEALRYE